VVSGEGPVGAQLMMVGEQLSDQEDLAGRPFVGPAGQMLDVARCNGMRLVVTVHPSYLLRIEMVRSDMIHIGSVLRILFSA
jgi:uracil-DNA glycosylase